MYQSVNKYYQYLNFVKGFSNPNPLSKYFTEIKYKNSMQLYLHKLDSGYYIFKYLNGNSFCYIFFTNIIQNYFNIDFLNNKHYTISNRKYKFSGYYAAGTNLYSVLPFMLGIFDYFNYYFKYDFDQPGFINIKEFAFGKTQKWYLFGTCFKLDASFVCHNVKKNDSRICSKK